MSGDVLQGEPLGHAGRGGRQAGDRQGFPLPSDEGRHGVPGLQPRQPCGADTVVQGALSVCGDPRGWRGCGRQQPPAGSPPAGRPSPSPAGLGTLPSPRSLEYRGHGAWDGELGTGGRPWRLCHIQGQRSALCDGAEWEPGRAWRCPGDSEGVWGTLEVPWGPWTCSRDLGMPEGPERALGNLEMPEEPLRFPGNLEMPWGPCSTRMLAAGIAVPMARQKAAAPSTHPPPRPHSPSLW